MVFTFVAMQTLPKVIKTYTSENHILHARWKEKVILIHIDTVLLGVCVCVCVCVWHVYIFVYTPYCVWIRLG